MIKQTLAKETHITESIFVLVVFQRFILLPVSDMMEVTVTRGKPLEQKPFQNGQVFED